ncbi:hypothetical protein [Nostoc punctiforme]|jgi:hypothetical protein|uniref:Uncharacterized protein n=1 Tax=Nostoc punctiforme (strain ATCC 29133 / PCC 73102) TaxID=63737 RepID=B2J1G0_NOSP7|nr:hypothetical protein [Nostoc punctiforme]ACC83391.1 hypothetical protein Npun_R5053 [Nostoc punctiforme PCC 73102]
MIMNSLKKSMRLTKILAFALSFLIFCFSTEAIAAPSTPPTLIITEKATITGGKFSIDTTTPPLPATTVIRSAKLFLPAGETGTINKIKITGPNGLEFGCQDIKVKNGVDLIKACGGPAVLEAGGAITYVAEGSGFAPKLNTKLKVVLSDEF